MIKENVGVGYEASITVKVTDKMIHQFAEMSGDHNLIHLDDEYAKSSRFGRRIAHGMIVGALISRALVDCIGQGGIYLSQNMKFVNPVFVDDDVIISIKITGVRSEKGIATVETIATKPNGDMVVKGDAVIMMKPSA